EPFGIIHGLSCRMYVLGKDKTFNVDANGVFQVFTTKNNSNLRYEIDNPKSYCIEQSCPGYRSLSRAPALLVRRAVQNAPRSEGAWLRQVQTQICNKLTKARNVYVFYLNLFSIWCSVFEAKL